MLTMELNLDDEAAASIQQEADKQGISRHQLIQAIVTAYANKASRQRVMRVTVEEAVAVALSYPAGTVFTLAKLFRKDDWSCMKPGYKTALCNLVAKDPEFQTATAYAGQDVSRRETYRRI